MPLSAKTHYSARILERRDISDDLWMIRVDPGEVFPYVPGQYATLGIPSAEGRYERPYSIVSAPHEKYLEFFIELVPHGQVTPRLYSCLPGDELTLRKTAKGIFTIDLAGCCTNHLLLSTVTGVAPFVSHIRTFYRQWKLEKFSHAHRMFLIDGASRSWELGYREEIFKIAAEVPWLTYIPTVSRPGEDKIWDGETGRVDDVIRKYAGSWGLTPENTKAYLCGHPGMIETATGILRRARWPEDAIEAEAYFTAGTGTAQSEEGQLSGQRR
jgi:ferredoxin/flavodoxin---NADP+ reductase